MSEVCEEEPRFIPTPNMVTETLPYTYIHTYIHRVSEQICSFFSKGCHKSLFHPRGIIRCGWQISKNGLMIPLEWNRLLWQPFEARKLHIIIQWYYMWYGHFCTLPLSILMPILLNNVHVWKSFQKFFCAYFGFENQCNFAMLHICNISQFETKN